MHKGHSIRATKFRGKNKPNRSRNIKNRLRSAVLEALEIRKMMSSSVALNSGILTLVGDPTTASSLTVNFVTGNKSVTANAQGKLLTVALTSVTGIKITGGSGADYIYIDKGIMAPTTISSGDGNDSIRGSGSTNTIIIGNGNTWVNCQGVTNYVQAGGGNDTILGGSGNDTIICGNGNDSINSSDGNDSITVGNGNDNVVGAAGNDTIVAGNGDDTLNGGLGNDVIIVGTGASVIIPDLGTNYITVGSSQATVVPSAGINTVVNSTGQTIATPVASTGTTANTNWVSYSAATPTGTNPRAVMQVLAPAPVVGIGIDVRALNSVLGTGSPIDANYLWNFGDSGSEYNALPGFNAAHVYTKAGTYTISLTVTNNLGQSSTVSSNITISADTRKVIYVNSVTGSDSNSGASTSTPIQTAARAAALLGNNTEILFERGQEFNVNSPFMVNFTNVLIGSYGSGAQPIINYTALATSAIIFDANSTSSKGVTVEDLTLTTMNGTQSTASGEPMGVMAGGYDNSVLRCTFMYVEYDINASGGPVGLLIQDNTEPLTNGTQGYFLWNVSTDAAVLGNSDASSVHEHIVRNYGGKEILLYQNNFTNLDGKGCIEMQAGSYAWIDSNTCNYGDIRVGPLGLWNEPLTDITNECVIQNNKINHVGISAFPGAEDISIRNNIITDPASGIMIDVKGQDGLGRQSSDIRILNNTGDYTTSTDGVFLKVENQTNGILLENNLFIEPSLAVGGYTAAPVYVNEADLSDFTYINGNVWQMPKTFYSYAGGGINYIGTTYISSGYKTASVWNAYAQVGTDYFSATVINSSFTPAAGSVAATVDSAVAGVFTDINGKARPSSGVWTAGAVQL